MKTFSTVAARMLPADDKWYAAVDPEDTDEWCITTPLPPPHRPPSITNLHLKFNAKHASVSSTETVPRVCVWKHYRLSIYVFTELSC